MLTDIERRRVEHDLNRMEARYDHVRAVVGEMHSKRTWTLGDQNEYEDLQRELGDLERTMGDLRRQLGW
jgi:hypothetical protein